LPNTIWAFSDKSLINLKALWNLNIKWGKIPHQQTLKRGFYMKTGYWQIPIFSLDTGQPCQIPLSHMFIQWTKVVLGVVH
jgi:hypothetical protein